MAWSRFQSTLKWHDDQGVSDQQCVDIWNTGSKVYRSIPRLFTPRKKKKRYFSKNIRWRFEQCFIILRILCDLFFFFLQTSINMSKKSNLRRVEYCENLRNGHKIFWLNQKNGEKPDSKTLPGSVIKVAKLSRLQLIQYIKYFMDLSSVNTKIFCWKFLKKCRGSLA